MQLFVAILGLLDNTIKAMLGTGLFRLLLGTGLVSVTVALYYRFSRLCR